MTINADAQAQKSHPFCTLPMSRSALDDLGHAQQQLAIGRCYVYVFPCIWEDHCKIGFSRDPLTRLQALHHRWFDVFDIDGGMLIETETIRDARDLELAIRAPFPLHNSPAPLTIRREAGGHTEWFRGVRSRLRDAMESLIDSGYRVHATLREWLRASLLARSDYLYSWTLSQLSQNELDGLAGTTAAQRAVGDVLDAHAALQIDLEPLLPTTVYRWHREVHQCA